jgi:hypothetical protein
MSYRINGERVTREEFLAHKCIGTPIQAGDRLNVVLSHDTFSPFVSPINGEYIATKNQLRDHEKTHNVVQVGSDLDSKANKIKNSIKERQLNEQSGQQPSE